MAEPITTASVVSGAASSAAAKVRSSYEWLQHKTSANNAGMLVVGILVAVQAGFAVNMYVGFTKCKYPKEEDKVPLGHTLNVAGFGIMLGVALIVIIMAVYNITMTKKYKVVPSA